jgi:hypothetical protein
VSQFTAAPALLREAQVDALAIAIPDSAGWAAEALYSGRHVFLMPPISFTPAEALRLARLAADRRVQFGFAPEDLSWNADEVGHMLRSAGPISPGPIKLTVRSAEPAGTDILHNGVRLLRNNILESAFAMRAATPRGNSWSAAFQFSRPGAILDMHCQSSAILPPGYLSIQAEIPAAGRTVRLTIESLVEQSGAPEHIPALSAFAADAARHGTRGLSHRSRHSLTTLLCGTLMKQSLDSGVPASMVYLREQSGAHG